MEVLKPKVDEVVSEKDNEKGDNLLDIFVELGRSHIKQIVDNENFNLPNLLLSLLGIPDISKFDDFINLGCRR